MWTDKDTHSRAHSNIHIRAHCHTYKDAHNTRIHTASPTPRCSMKAIVLRSDMKGTGTIGCTEARYFFRPFRHTKPVFWMPEYVWISLKPGSQSGRSQFGVSKYKLYFLKQCQQGTAQPTKVLCVHWTDWVFLQLPPTLPASLTNGQFLFIYYYLRKKLTHCSLLSFLVLYGSFTAPLTGPEAFIPQRFQWFRGVFGVVRKRTHFSTRFRVRGKLSATSFQKPLRLDAA